MVGRIPLSNGGFTIIDDDDFEYLAQWRWKRHPQGYACRTSWDAGSQKWLCVLIHRLIANTPDHLQTDHINRDRLDNRRANLRNATGSENSRNQGLSSRNTSGYRGVTFDRSRGKWQAKTKHLGRWVFLGRYETVEEASRAREAFEAELLHRPAA